MARLCLVLGILCAVGCQVSETNDTTPQVATTPPVTSSKNILPTSAPTTAPAVSVSNKAITSASPTVPTVTSTSLSPSPKKEETTASPTTIAAAASTTEVLKALNNPLTTKTAVPGVATSTVQASSSPKSKDDVSVTTTVPTRTKFVFISTVKGDVTSALPTKETTQTQATQSVPTSTDKLPQQTPTTGPTKDTQQATGGLSSTPSLPGSTTSSATTSVFNQLVPNPVPETTSSRAEVQTTTNPAPQPMGKNVPKVYCRNDSVVPENVVKINVDFSSDCTDNSSFTEEEHKAFKEVCDALKTAYKSSDPECTIQVASTEGKLAIVDAVLQLRIDSSELYKELKASMKEDKSPLFSFGNAQHSINDDVVSIPLISAIVSLAVVLLLIAAIYGCYQQRQTRKREQRLTEELQTMENGYHDNPTLEVMETAPEMQEKKGGPNGELGDSWIVPLDNLTREDLEEEEDTHL
ncbi:podocalyxin [Hyperolius riggenbachi]|uniref:podocalyxin n=1 Tax=Hyperolius riggenbachi TaxID=752182 RepID=UPI0035A2F54A